MWIVNNTQKIKSKKLLLYFPLTNKTTFFIILHHLNENHKKLFELNHFGVFWVGFVYKLCCICLVGVDGNLVWRFQIFGELPVKFWMKCDGFGWGKLVEEFREIYHKFTMKFYYVLLLFTIVNSKIQCWKYDFLSLSLTLAQHWLTQKTERY